MAEDPLIGQQLANFRLVRLIGRGGMAQVYYGWDVKLNRPVALKVIDARYRGDPEYARRFVQEAQAVAAWRHEHVIHIYYADDQAGLFFYAMEFIDGPDLAEVLAGYAARGERMPTDDVLRIGRAVASALDYAHARGVVHRDVKPSNVMLARDGRVVLGDFGLALDVRQGSLGEAFGSPHYMAPEQARRSTEAVPASDLYSLGVILYEMLTGAVPFDDPSPAAVAVMHVTQPPPSPRERNPALSAAVEAVLLRALDKQPEQRYPSGLALMQALEAALGTMPDTLPPPAGARPSLPVSPVPVQQQVAQTPARMQGLGHRTPGVGARAGGLRRTQALVLGAAGLLVLCLLAGAALVLGPWRLVPAAGAPTSPPPEATPVPSGVPTAEAVGPPLVLLHNPNSFYILNVSGSEAPLDALRFERLDANGQPAGGFEGARWAVAAPRLAPGWCARLLVLDSAPYLEPHECAQGYASTLAAAPDDPAVFWTPREGSAEFRVLWGETELGRCSIAAGACRVGK